MGKRFIAARLRVGLDDDLAAATEHLDSQSKSELVRTGLRLALGIKTHRVMEVKEEPVTVKGVGAVFQKPKMFGAAHVHVPE